MKRSPIKGRAAVLALAGVALASLIRPAIGEAWAQDAPKSLLPLGFGAPVAPAAPAPAAPAPGPTGAPAAPTPLLPNGVPPAAPTELVPPAETASEDAFSNEAAAEAAAKAEALELPEQARRSTEIVGPLAAENGGLGPDAWGEGNGVFLEGVMRRLDAPVASRWASMLLRRALMSRAAAPAGVDPVDWVAERAWLLLRMGEADAARLTVQSVDTIRYTPRMLSVAQQVALATADPAALCPIAEQGAASSDEPSWVLAQAICAALSGEPGVAGALIDRARQARLAKGIDLLLAEKAVGAGSNGRRAINIEWAGVYQLTSWRFGLANALNVPVPDQLYDSAGPQVRAWAARAPMLTTDQRIAPARAAAVLGVFSSQSLIDLYSAQVDAADLADDDQSPAGHFRVAYLGGDEAARMAALRSLWDMGEEDPAEHYASLILTARAATRIAPDARLADDAGSLVAAMLAAGLDRPAERWSAVVGAMSGSKSDEPWALLALGGDQTVVDLSPARVRSYVERAGLDHRHRAQLLVAGLAGLDRLSTGNAAEIAGEIGIELGSENGWTRALDAAVRGHQPATVALLAAAGMQTRDWHAVPADALFHIVSALRRAGLEPEARMIAAEAIARA